MIGQTVFIKDHPFDNRHYGHRATVLEEERVPRYRSDAYNGTKAILTVQCECGVRLRKDRSHTKPLGVDGMVKSWPLPNKNYGQQGPTTPIRLKGSTPRRRFGQRLSIKPEARMPQAEDCPHYWLIDSPNGPTSMGVCRWCGTRREHLNSIPQMDGDEPYGSFGAHRRGVR